MSRLSDIPWETISIPGLIKRNHELRGDAAALLLDEAEAGGQEASRAKEGRAAQAISYTELYHVVGLLCDLLSQKFQGAHIGILGENSNEWFLAFLGILCSSSAAVPVEIELSAEEAAGRLLRADCEAVFLSEDYRDYGEVFAARGIEVLPLTLVK
ncbi:MAG: AMP-binding protein, partial [Lachnospiraceae bacterium]|nr:AMP-binding protein [Candidatus Hippenecus merdae]